MEGGASKSGFSNWRGTFCGPSRVAPRVSRIGAGTSALTIAAGSVSNSAIGALEASGANPAVVRGIDVGLEASVSLGVGTLLSMEETEFELIPESLAGAAEASIT